MTVERRRLLAALAAMAVVIFFVGLISVLRDGRIIIDAGHLLLTLAVGVLTYFGLPARSPDDRP